MHRSQEMENTQTALASQSITSINGVSWSAAILHIAYQAAHTVAHGIEADHAYSPVWFGCSGHASAEGDHQRNNALCGTNADVETVNSHARCEA